MGGVVEFDGRCLMVFSFGIKWDGNGGQDGDGGGGPGWFKAVQGEQRLSRRLHYRLLVYDAI